MSSHDLLRRPTLSRPVVNANGIFFWCLGTVVRVRFSFFLIGLLAAGGRSVSELLVWVAVVFVGVLIHELGHAQAARRYGADPSIELYTMGGLTSWAWARPPTLGQRLVTSLAGPGAGFVAGGVVALTWLASGASNWPYLLRLAADDFVWVSLGWGLFNLVPMLPLDGGSAMDALLQAWLGSGRGRRMARLASCGLGVLGFVLGVSSPRYRWVALLCALFAYDNFTRLRSAEAITTRAEGPREPV